MDPRHVSPDPADRLHDVQSVFILCVFYRSRLEFAVYIISNYEENEVMKKAVGIRDKGGGISFGVLRPRAPAW